LKGEKKNRNVKIGRRGKPIGKRKGSNGQVLVKREAPTGLPSGEEKKKT